MTSSSEKKIRSVGSLNRLIGVISAMLIFFACLIIWEMSDVPKRKDDDGMGRLAAKIGQTYTAELHQQISDINKDVDDSVFALVASLEKGGRILLMLGLAIFAASVAILYILKKLLRELAESGPRE